MNEPVSLSCVITTNPAVQAGADGSINIEANGGVPDYSYSIDNGPPTTMMGSYADIPYPQGTYIVEVTDADGNSCATTVTIDAPPALNIAGSTAWGNTTCGEDNGTLTVTIDSSTLGGTAPYFYEITGPDAQTPTSSLNLTGLEAGTYTVEVTDGSPTQQVVTETVVIANSIAPTISFIPAWFCWEAPNQYPTISPSFDVTTNAGAYTIEWEAFDIGGNDIPQFSSSQSFPANVTNPTITSVLVGPYLTNFKVIDAFGCIANIGDYYDLRPGQGHVPTTPMSIEYIPEEYCWVDGSPAQIYPQFLVTTDGPFTISWIGGSESFPASPVPVYVTLATLVSAAMVNFTLTEITNNCSTVSGNINLLAGGGNVPSSPLTGVISTNFGNNQLNATNSSGGWGAYTYIWFKNGVPTSNTNPLYNIPPFETGDFTCKITDANGCFVFSNSITV